VRERGVADHRQLPALRVVAAHRALRLPRGSGATAGAEEPVMPKALAAMAAVAIGYFSGALPWGLWLGRWFRGVDVRTLGSGNLGATNGDRSLRAALRRTTGDAGWLG